MGLTTVVETRSGKLQGYFTGRSLLFAGVPYAAPPTDENRFMPPLPVPAWGGIRDATHFGRVQPQKPSRFARFLGPDPQPQSEDSLFLNVWTPSTEGPLRPVILYIHGGAWVSGSGSMPIYHGESFAARHDIVFVSINYRLGELGGLYLGHLDSVYKESGNLALLDQIAALEWVRDNIVAFGGDPDNVTICGQSAGGNAVMALMAAPRAAGLFHRVMGLSVSSMTPLRQIADAVETSERFFELAGVKTIAELKELDIDRLLDVRHQAMRGATKRTVWGALEDGVLIPAQPLKIAEEKGLAPVPLLIGSCYDDYLPYLSILGAEMVPQNDADLSRIVARFGIDGGELLQRYREIMGPATAREIFVEAMTDFTFRQTAIKFAERHGARQPTFLFEFKWRSPVQDGALGAGHTVEIPFAFHNLSTPSTPYHLGANPPEALADQMHAAWSAFACSGDPNVETLPTWHTYEPGGRQTMILDQQSALVADPKSRQRLYWANE